MDEFNMLPIYRNGFGEISNGIEVVVPEFCKKNCDTNKKCKEHYAKLSNEETGFYKCPYGFGSYVFQIGNDSDNYIFTCLCVEGYYDKKKIYPKIKEERKLYREITYANLEKYVQAYIEFWVNQCRYKNYKAFVDEIFHDIRKYNQQLKVKNDRIYRGAQAGKKFAKFLDISKSIQVLSWFLTLRINNYDFSFKEGLMTSDVKSRYNIYNIFFKVRACIKERAEEKNIKIILEANRECRDMKAYECVELLPFILIDNAIKYSPEGEEIYVKIDEKGTDQRITVRSLGPIVYEEEVEKLFSQGYRGINADKMTSSGMGIGLYTAKHICELNDIGIKLNPGQEMKRTWRNMTFSEFVVDLNISIE